MWKKNIRKFYNFIIKHSMVVFPGIVIVLVAITVAIVLGADNPDESEITDLFAVENISAVNIGETDNDVSLFQVNPEEPLVRSEDEAIYSLIATYYNALANGDVETIKGISNFVKDTEVVRIEELSKYTESYPVIEIYTKSGPVENSWIAYVYTKVTFYGYEDQVPGFKGFYICTDENGNLYLNDGETDDAVLEYIKAISVQEDVIELNNRINVEYKDLMTTQTTLFEYISELEREVSIAAGEAIASQNASSEEGSDNSDTEGNVPGNDQQTSANQNATGTATTTVNVRISDSELADKLGKLSEGQQVKVLEMRPNGWTKVIFEGKEGYIMSKYLLVTGYDDGNGASNGEESGSVTGESQTVQRTAKANATLNLRSEPSQTSEKLGTVIEGNTVEVLSEEGEWSRIRYNGLIGYVMSEYLQ